MTDPNRLFDAALDRYGAPLEEDAARGEVALAAGRSAARGRRRRRQAGRVAALLLVTLLGLWWLPDSGGPESVGRPGEERSGGPVASAGSWRVVADQPGIATRLAVGATSAVRRLQVDGSGRVQRLAPRTTQRLDDAALGEWLRRSGRAPGRIRVGDEVLVPGAADLAQLAE